MTYLTVNKYHALDFMYFFYSSISSEALSLQGPGHFRFHSRTLWMSWIFFDKRLAQVGFRILLPLPLYHPY